jgi:hypothetical protein
LVILEKALTLEEAVSYTFWKHHLYQNLTTDVRDLATSVFGLHAARLPTPYVTAFVRIPSFKPHMLWDRLHTKRDLIKLRCMRKTLHILPLDLAPIAHKATLFFRLAECYSRYKKLAFTESYIDKLKSEIKKLLEMKAMSIEEINMHLVFDQSQLSGEENSKQHLSAVVKELWESGEVCYLNTNRNWGKESRLYGLTRKEYPSLNLDELDTEKAIEQLVFYHIKAYGPVSVGDTCWWSGLGKTVVLNAMKTLSKQLIQVQLLSDNKPYFMEKNDYHIFRNWSIQAGWVSLAAYEDPSLKGYYESRNRYVDEQHYHHLFNRIGEARASIIVNGKVMGIWVYDAKKNSIQYDLLESLSDIELNQIAQEVRKMQDFLNSH